MEAKPQTKIGRKETKAKMQIHGVSGVAPFRSRLGSGIAGFMAYSQEGLIGPTVTPGAFAFSDPYSVCIHCRRSVDQSQLRHTVRLARSAIETRARCPPIRFQNTGSLQLPGSRSQKAIALSITTNRREPECQTGACILGQSCRKPGASLPPGTASSPAPRGLRSRLQTTRSCGRRPLAGLLQPSFFMK